MILFRLFAVLLVLSPFAGAADWTAPAQVPMAVPSWDWCMPSISHDGQTLFFASDSDGIANGPWDLYAATWQGTSWSDQIFLGSAINASGSDFIEQSPAIGYDDTTLYFARGNGRDSIWVSYFHLGAWTQPQALDSSINGHFAGGPAISHDGNTLYFHSNRPGGFGDLDVWKSVNSGGVWQTPVNLGPDVNTSGIEADPSIAANDSDLVFCRAASPNDTASIWHCMIGSGTPAQCIIYSHYENTPGPNGTYFFRDPCISSDGVRLYLSCFPNSTEPTGYIYMSSRVTGVSGQPWGCDRGSNPGLLSSPNPFRAATDIQYQLARAGHVRLSIYNVAGQLVKCLTEGAQAAGQHRVIWDGRDGSGQRQASGLYFCRLSHEGRIATRRMVVLR